MKATCVSRGEDIAFSLTILVCLADVCFAQLVERGDPFSTPCVTEMTCVVECWCMATKIIFSFFPHTRAPSRGTSRLNRFWGRSTCWSTTPGWPCKAPPSSRPGESGKRCAKAGICECQYIGSKKRPFYRWLAWCWPRLTTCSPDTAQRRLFVAHDDVLTELLAILGRCFCCNR